MSDGLLVGLFLAMPIAVFWFISSMADGRYTEEYGRVAQAALPAYWHEQDAPSMHDRNLVHPIVFWFPEGGDSSTAAVSFNFFVPLGGSQGTIVRTGGGDMFPPHARQRTLEGAAEYASRKFGHLAGIAVEKLQREFALTRTEELRREAERVTAEAQAATGPTTSQLGSRQRGTRSPAAVGAGHSRRTQAETRWAYPAQGTFQHCWRRPRHRD